jgi:hypothetical protein
MGKKYKGKDCVYCGALGASQTGDHIFARGFFSVDDRANLPQVPSCATCNSAKSQLETYLTAVLPFGGQTPDAVTLLEQHVPKRLEANAKLHRKLSEGAQSERLASDNAAEVMMLPFDGQQVEQLFVYVVKGLHFHHWKQVVLQDCIVRAGTLSAVGQDFFDQILSMNGTRVTGCVGRNVFEYEGVKSLEHPWITIWKFKAYGGVQVGGDPDLPDETSNVVYAYSAPNSMGSLFGD